MKDCLSLHSLRLKNFNDRRDFGERDERIYTYTDKYKRHLFRQPFIDGKVAASKKVFESLVGVKTF